MNRDNSPWGPTPAAELQWTDSGEPYSRRFEDIYFSREDGVAESRHVFLQGNRLPQRWLDGAPEQFCIGETGFGTGLNFLLTWQQWRQLPPPRPRLHYVSIEKFPLSREELQRALQPWTELAPLAAQLAGRWPGRLPGQHRLDFDKGAIILDLWWEDVVDALPDLAARGPCIDAWYLDGFAPARNDAMWAETLYPAIAALSRPAATFATFTAAGHVRRGLTAAGFAVSKVAGFGRKRESLAGSLSTQPSPASSADTPWDLPAEQSPTPPAALVIGAGLAGCATARALANRGLQVQLLEASELASAASGNAQGILYTRLSHRHSTLTDFALQSFRHATGLYTTLFSEGQLKTGVDGALCGMFHLNQNRAELAAMAQRLRGLEDLAAVLEAAAATPLLGCKPAHGGYWFPASGWLHPPALCRALISHPSITLREHCGAIALSREDGDWLAHSTGGDLLASAPAAVICCGTGSRSFAALDWLPLRPIRGQTTDLPQWEASAALSAALCHKGYIAPARDGLHTIGASFLPGDSDLQLRDEEQAFNLRNLATALPQWETQLGALEARKLPGRVGLRCASPDYLPMAGGVPDRERFLRAYAPLRQNARQTLNLRGPHVPGLYLNTAHGSRGLTSTPLCAELVASLLCHEPAPLSRQLGRALSPARFLIRDLARNRI